MGGFLASGLYVNVSLMPYLGFLTVPGHMETQLTCHFSSCCLIICYFLLSKKPLCVVNIPRSSAVRRRRLWGQTQSSWKLLHLEREKRRIFLSLQSFPSSLFFSSSLPTKQMFSQHAVTCFSFCWWWWGVLGGGDWPPDFTPNMHFIWEVDLREGNDSAIQKWKRRWVVIEQ